MEHLLRHLNILDVEPVQLARHLVELQAKNTQLSDTNEHLNQKVEQLSQKNEHLFKENQILLEAIRHLKLKRFGRSADVVDPAQLALFGADEAEAAEPVTNQEDNQNAGPSKPASKAGRRPLPKDLPCQERILDVAESDKLCACCGSAKKRIGEETSERLGYTQAKLWLERTVRPKYALTCACTSDEGVKAVVVAPAPEQLIPQSLATPSLVSQIIAAKIVDGLPFYRQEQQFARLGVELSRATMSNWTIRVAERCQEVMNLLTQHWQRKGAIQLDETTVQVMDEAGRKNTTKSYMWVGRAGPALCRTRKHPRDPDPNDPEIVLFWYRETRASAFVRELLADYRGSVQTDDYAGYDWIASTQSQEKGLIHVQCLAHLRRKFTDATRIIPGQKRAKTLGLAGELLQDIQAIYRAEHRILAEVTTATACVERRRSETQPLLEALQQRIEGLKDQVVPKSLLGQAIAYARNVLPQILNYVACAALTLDTNLLENKIRPFVLGRKNWLMAGCPEGAHALATWFSLIETAKANGWDPYHYLRFLLEGLEAHRPAHELLPTLPPQVATPLA